MTLLPGKPMTSFSVWHCLTHPSRPRAAWFTWGQAASVWERCWFTIVLCLPCQTLLTRFPSLFTQTTTIRIASFVFPVWSSVNTYWMRERGSEWARQELETMPANLQGLLCGCCLLRAGAGGVECWEGAAERYLSWHWVWRQTSSSRAWQQGRRCSTLPAARLPAALPSPGHWGLTSSQRTLHSLPGLWNSVLSLRDIEDHQSHNKEDRCHHLSCISFCISGLSPAPFFLEKILKNGINKAGLLPSRYRPF